MGLVYFAVALVTSLVFGLPLVALVSVTAGHPHGHPVLRPVRVVGAAGRSWRSSSSRASCCR